MSRDTDVPAVAAAVGLAAAALAALVPMVAGRLRPALQAVANAADDDDLAAVDIVGLLLLH